MERETEVGERERNRDWRKRERERERDKEKYEWEKEERDGRERTRKKIEISSCKNKEYKKNLLYGCIKKQSTQKISNQKMKLKERDKYTRICTIYVQ